MKNHNDELRNSKENGVKEAIKYLYDKGVRCFSKKVIADATKILFKDERNKQISANTLSKKDYYKNNLEKWIEEITGINNDKLETGRNNSLIIRKKNAKENYLNIEKTAKKLALDIVNGKIKCDKMSKVFLTQKLMELKDKKGYKMNQSTLSSEFYEPIYENVITLLNQEIQDSSDKENGVTLKEFSKLKVENERLKEINNNFINGLFFIKEGESNSAIYKDGDGNDLYKAKLDTEKLYYYMKLNEDIFTKKKEVNAYNLFKDIVNQCKKV
ncbi:hypothetical protein [Peribacillus sp. Hz7]|uniref:hypothetical protein n=1 Tax=Peribacillus sp. Hz7 TaxID=3344873 RepID=UPI0035C9E44C